MKRMVAFGVLIVIVIGLGILYFALTPEPAQDCAGIGEAFSWSHNDPSLPGECCEGLKNVRTSNHISVADKCYFDGSASGYQTGICSDCGNGICEPFESVCGCSEDCAGLGLSDFDTVQEFCDTAYGMYCSDHFIDYVDPDLCALCE